MQSEFSLPLDWQLEVHFYITAAVIMLGPEVL